MRFSNPASPPPDILHLGKYFSPEPGGIEHALKSIVEATRGHLSHWCLVASREGPTRIEEVPWGRLLLLKERGTFLLAPVLPSLPFVIHQLRRKHRAPLIMIHVPNPVAIVALAASLLALPKREKIVVWHHADVLFEESWKRAIHRFYRLFEEFVLRRADAFVAATPHHLDSSPILSRFRDRTTTIPYAVPDAWFTLSEEERAAAEEIRKAMGGRFVLFVGRLVPYKGLDTLVAAARSIDCRVVVVGTGPLEKSLRREISARQLGDRIILRGHVDALRPWYAGCELLVLPSTSALEGFGIVQIEAMGLGRPVVTSNLPTGVTWVNRDGETGLTFPVGDADALARSCNTLLADEELRRRLGENARVRALREFSYASLRGRVVGLFDELCEGARP